MKKLADLYFNYDVKTGEYNVASHANMDEKNRELVEDLMRNSKVKVALNNACRNVNNIVRKDISVKVADLEVNMSSSVTAASKIKFEVIVLKTEDESDLMISLYSLVDIQRA